MTFKKSDFVCNAYVQKMRLFYLSCQHSVCKELNFLGDDQSVSIQMRGGPEPMMVTSWAQIMSLDPSYIGIYHCIATNSEGSVAAFAGVGVYSKEL